MRTNDGKRNRCALSAPYWVTYLATIDRRIFHLDGVSGRAGMISTTRVIRYFPGTVEKGIVEVTNCFCVPHKESESQVEADLTYGMDLYDLNHRVNAQENIVGWWATGNEVGSQTFDSRLIFPLIACN